MIHLIHLIYAIPVAWLIRRDTKLRPGISPAVWIPTFWVGIISSKALTAWLGIGAGGDTLEGSPLDALFYFAMIGSAAIVLSQRGVDWYQLARRNKPVVFFYLFLLVSVLWANSSFVSFKRWFKEFGNILIILVLLTETNPMQAIRAVFVRCGYFLIPLSVIYIRYLPNYGRRYSRSGGLEVTGVTNQKNTLGVMVMVCTLILLWDWLERLQSKARLPKFERYLTPAMFVLSLYLLHQSSSKTSLLCLIVGGTIVTAIRFQAFRRRIDRFGIYALCGAIAFFALDSTLGVSEKVVASLGRDMTFTGRTEVWDVLLRVGTNPVVGTGFMSFWDDRHFQSRLPYWVGASAHNGYLDVYLAGGIVGVFFLAQMLILTGWNINRSLKSGNNFAVVRFAIFVIVLIANFSESNFALMTPIGFLFLLAAIAGAPRQQMMATPVLGTRQRTFAEVSGSASKDLRRT